MKFHILAFVLAGAVFSSPVMASDQTAHILQVMGDSYGGGYGFYMGSRTGKPTCAASDDVFQILNPSSDNSKAMLSMILTAYASGKPVFIHGNGTCDAAAPSRESVGYIVIQ
jgi:hypothetical protein